VFRVTRSVLQQSAGANLIILAGEWLRFVRC
jgi:hypothetical protein